jgi:hypothetical protein
LQQFLSILSNLTLTKISPILAILPIRLDWPNQSGSGPTRPDQAWLGVDFGDVPIGWDAENGALLLRHACPDEPEDGKYEYYYVSYSYW